MHFTRVLLQGEKKQSKIYKENESKGNNNEEGCVCVMKGENSEA